MILTGANQHVVAGYQAIPDTDSHSVIPSGFHCLQLCHMWWCRVDQRRDTGLQLMHTTFECTRKLKACIITLCVSCKHCPLDEMAIASWVEMMTRTWVGLPIRQQTLSCAVSGDLRPGSVCHVHEKVPVCMVRKVVLRSHPLECQHISCTPHGYCSGSFRPSLKPLPWTTGDA